MKKMTALLLAMAMLLSLAACGGNSDKPGGTTPGASSNNDADGSAPQAAFVVAFDQDDMPFSYLDEKGELVGLSVDVAREACNRLGWELMAEPIDWSTKDTVLDEGTVDCVWGQATESEIYLEESDHIWLTYGEIFVDATALVSSEAETIPQLEGKVLVADPEAVFALTGEDASEWGKSVWSKAASTSIADSAEDAYKALFSGKCDAVIVNAKSDEDIDFNQFDAEVDEDGYSLKTLYSSEDDETSETLYYRAVGGCFANYTEDYEKFSDVIYQMADDGTVKTLMEQWDDTPWGRLSKRFTAFEYVNDAGEDDDEWEEEEEDEELIELSEEELAELFGDESVLEITDEDYEEGETPAQ